jgi:hypothetical protein
MAKCDRCGKEAELYKMVPQAAWKNLCLPCIERMGFSLPVSAQHPLHSDGGEAPAKSADTVITPPQVS